jgi:hypothetical protein
MMLIRAGAWHAKNSNAEGSHAWFCISPLEDPAPGVKCPRDSLRRLFGGNFTRRRFQHSRIPRHRRLLPGCDQAELAICLSKGSGKGPSALLPGVSGM